MLRLAQQKQWSQNPECRRVFNRVQVVINHDQLDQVEESMRLAAERHEEASTQCQKVARLEDELATCSSKLKERSAAMNALLTEFEFFRTSMVSFMHCWCLLAITLILRPIDLHTEDGRSSGASRRDEYNHFNSADTT